MSGLLQEAGPYEKAISLQTRIYFRWKRGGDLKLAGMEYEVCVGRWGG